MISKPSILQVNTSEEGGGAEKIAWSLHNAYVQRGYPSWFCVREKRKSDSSIFEIPNDNYRNKWARLCINMGELFSPFIGKVRGIWRIRNYLSFKVGHFNIGQTRRWLEIKCGHEDFDYPATRHILDLLPSYPEIMHCHNLHGGYFDLRAIAWLSHKIPLIFTLHDAWLLSGHCAHSFDCERWKSGCGYCPDLSIYPAIQKDATAYNWKRKQDIYSKSRIYVASPSQWLMNKVERSILAPAIIESKVIPNGVDLSVFHPNERISAKSSLNLPTDSYVLLFAANGIRKNLWKDYRTMSETVLKVAKTLNKRRLLFIALGEDAPDEQIGQAVVRFIPYQKDERIVAGYYQAADVYVHAAHAEVWGLTITEALACGTPVVATSVGGIPEQVKDGKTGFLAPMGDANSMADAVIKILTDESLRNNLSQAAAEDAKNRFSIARQVNDYLNWYEEIIEGWKIKKA